MKTCNSCGCCSFQVPDGSLCGCAYEGYCDYQRPRDSWGDFRPWREDLEEAPKGGEE